MGKRKINLGVLRVLYNRGKQDLNIISTVLLFFTADKVGVEIKWWYIALIIVYFILRALWDDKRLISQEIEYTVTNNKIFMEMKNKVDYLYKKTRSLE